MTRELGRKLWSFLLRQRPAPEVIVLQDEGDRRAISVAYAICDVLGLKRSTAICNATGQEWNRPENDVPPNRHVYDMTKESRRMVV
jgi:hypothetical protein